MNTTPACAAVTQPGHRAWRSRQRLPARNRPDTCSRFRVVANPRKTAAQLDSCRQLALLVEDGADCIGIGLGDEKHPKSMVTHRTASKHGAIPYR